MKRPLLATLAVALLASTTYAQTPPPMAGGPGIKHFEEEDTNRDGVISKDEWLARAGERFNEIDANHDGKISPEELHAFREQAMAKHGGRRGMMEPGVQQGGSVPAGLNPNAH